MILKRTFAKAAVATVLLASSFVALGQAYPSRPIRMIVPFPAGAGPDIMARLFADALSKSLGQGIVVDNRPGASANIGANAVAKSAADGYTVLYGFNQIATMNPHLFAKLPYDVNKELTPVTQLLSGPYILLASRHFGPSNLAETLELAKREPGKINFASYGPGTASHLGLALIEDASGTSMLHVPYKQGVLNDLVANTVSLTLEPATPAIPWVLDGRLKAVAVTGSKRLKALPNVPTLAETLPGITLAGWQGIWVPAGTPRDVIAKLNEAFVNALHTPAIDAKLQADGVDSIGSTPEQMAATIRTESAVWGKLIRQKNIHLD